MIHGLARRRTDCVGTVRVNRKGIPNQIKTKKKIGKGECVAMFRRKQMVLKWKDKKDVAMISTIHDNKMVDIENRKKILKKQKLFLLTIGSLQ
ncbi:unnamed protein product [Acanthoscelides obtectus]|uniref:PiggyBac transposable element-derived protein domain-containing protein n=1 Tax=Acanthoscelides obtectus TaxID=200917 RepID=A0A9P0M197_ACAOB|nr:unnamed protein product [Acanthoscelides obtectus]CAK1672552.1 PiggyBac transposable element-derived protein 4 [Acanthoscelides obtectus]